MGGQDFNEKFYRMCQKTDDLHSAVFDKDGLKDVLGKIVHEHNNCMELHKREREAKERTDEFKTQRFVIEDADTKKDKRNRMYAFAGSVLGSVSLVEVAKWLYAFLTINPKK